MSPPVIWICLVQPEGAEEPRIRAWTFDPIRAEKLKQDGLEMTAVMVRPASDEDLRKADEALVQRIKEACAQVGDRAAARFADNASRSAMAEEIAAAIRALIPGPSEMVVSGDLDPAMLAKLRDHAGVFTVMREGPDHLADAWHEISASIKRAGDEGGMVLACAMIERRRLRLRLPPISTVPERKELTESLGPAPYFVPRAGE